MCVELYDGCGLTAGDPVFIIAPELTCVTSLAPTIEGAEGDTENDQEIWGNEALMEPDELKGPTFTRYRVVGALTSEKCPKCLLNAGCDIYQIACLIAKGSTIPYSREP